MCQHLLVVTPAQLLYLTKADLVDLVIWNLGTGCRLMASPDFHQVVNPAADLHTAVDDMSSTQLPSILKARSTRQKRSLKHSVWYMASWNVRSLLDVEGPNEVAKQGRGVKYMEDRKIDQVVIELSRYKVVVCALQETKWFGNEVYKVGNGVVLSSGRSVPGLGEIRQRREGVAIVLIGPALEAWKNGGSVWKAWLSRIILVMLVDDSFRGSNHLHVLSCYAPTFSATRQEKDSFYSTLQFALDAIALRENVLFLGDFKARIRS